MSWDYVTDEHGNLEIIVTRWYSDRLPQRRVSVVANGFMPFEPVQIEVISQDDKVVIPPKSEAEG